jgi:prohibitin 2
MSQQLIRDLIRQAQSAAPPPNSPRSRAFRVLLTTVAGTAVLGYATYQSLFTVNGGNRAVMFSRLSGVKPTVYGEGTHLRVPWLEWPTVFDIRTRPKTLRSPTGTKDLQTVDISLRVLFKPVVEALPRIYSQLGTNYDERVLPSIANETLKRYNTDTDTESVRERDEMLTWTQWQATVHC